MIGRQLIAGSALALTFGFAISAQGQPYTNPVTQPPVVQFPRTVPPPPTAPGHRGLIPSPDGTKRVVTLIPSPPVFAPPGAEHAVESQLIPAKLELNDGTLLTGEITSDNPLTGSALFGPIAIPMGQIRGLDWQAKSEEDEPERKATVVLTNGDSLTVSVTIPTIQLKTTWGHAVVLSSKVRTMVLTADKYKWEDTPLGRQLVPVDDEKPATEGN